MLRPDARVEDFFACTQRIGDGYVGRQTCVFLSWTGTKTSRMEEIFISGNLISSSQESDKQVSADQKKSYIMLRRY